MANEVGEILRSLREIKQITIMELAESTGLNASTIHRYETLKTKVTQDVLEKVTKALSVTVPDVYAIKENPSILEDPFTYYKGKALTQVTISVTLDGTVSTLNSWFATLKKLNTSLA